MLVLLVMLGVSLLPAPRLDYSLPKLTGILLGISVFYACLNGCRTAQSIDRATTLVVVLGCLATTAGVLLMDWQTLASEKQMLSLGIYQVVPIDRPAIQSSTIATAGVNPNEIGGTIALLLPIALVLALRTGRSRRVAAVCAGVLGVELLLTQSRASLAGVAIALAPGVVQWAGRRGALGILLVACAATLLTALFVLVSGPGQTVSAAAALLSERLQIWKLSLAMLLDMPFTGVGLNNLSVVVDAHYGEGTLAYPSVGLNGERFLPHAHNLAIQTALDLGLIGLAAFVSIVLVAIRGGLDARCSPHRPLANALLLGLVGHGAFSMVDAITLGAKPGVLVWAVLGLLAALGACAGPRPALGSASARSWVPAAWPRRSGRMPSGLVSAALAVLAVYLLVTPATLNGLMVILHRPTARDVVAESSAIPAALDVAETFAWGPYHGRIRSARALVDRLQAGSAR
jgi:putative inorganic carbon (HCO3(-)) transporter